MSHEDVADDLPAYALDALAPKERACVAAHLASCARCREELHRLEETLGALGTAAPQVDPPPALREQLIASLDGVGDAPVHSVISSRWVRPAMAIAAVLLLGLAGSLALLAHDLAGVRGDLAAMQGQQATVSAVLADSSQPIRLATDSAPQAYGMLYLGSQPRQAVLVVKQLPPTQPGRLYQIWLVQQNGARVSGGTFTTDAGGNATVMLNAPAPVMQYQSLGITEEPAPHGSASPTGKRVAGCALAH
ncbi:MAG TPA: anti-sigma factor [Thermomicrobiaceae bacterium]|nr:anti-sigma factor [Thermomicrobiaceae bacterium]